MMRPRGFVQAQSWRNRELEGVFSVGRVQRNEEFRRAWILEVVVTHVRIDFRGIKRHLLAHRDECILERCCGDYISLES